MGEGVDTPVPRYKGGIVLCVRIAVKMQNSAQASAGARLSMVDLEDRASELWQLNLQSFFRDYNCPIVRED